MNFTLHLPRPEPPRGYVVFRLSPRERVRPRLSLRHGPRCLEGGRRPHQVNTLQRLAENGVVDILRRPQDDPALPRVRWFCAERQFQDEARSAFAGHANQISAPESTSNPASPDCL
jgi:hypothetical protein